MNYLFRPFLLLTVIALGVSGHTAAVGPAPQPNAAQPALAADLGRNPVNLTDKGIPTDWNVDDKKPKNIKLGAGARRTRLLLPGGGRRPRLRRHQ